MRSRLTINLFPRARGTNALEAYQDIDNRKETILAKSRTTGSNYGQRLLPQKNTVARDYFVKGTENFVKANALAAIDDWQGALKLWEIELGHRDAKIRSRSCHNIAVLNERNENLEEALSWAKKALENHQNKTTENYLSALEKRIAQKELLDEQLAQLAFSD